MPMIATIGSAPCDPLLENLAKLDIRNKYCDENN